MEFSNHKGPGTSDSSSERLKPEILLSSLNEVLGELENDADLFFNLLKSDPARMDAVRKA